MMTGQSVVHHSTSMTASRATSRQGWSQIWLHVSENRVFCACSRAYESLGGMPWAQGVAGSNPVAPTISLSTLHNTKQLRELAESSAILAICFASPRIATFRIELGLTK